MNQKFIAFFIAFIFQFSLFAIDQPSLIFVHIGKEIPTHVQHSIIQAREFNPDSKIYFLVSKSAVTNSTLYNQEFFHFNHIEFIDISQLKKEPVHREFDSINSFSQRFRNGFWSHTTERFFYIYDFIKKFNIQDCVHLENDVMLYVQLEKLLPIFRTLETKIGVPMQAKTNAIPSFVYMKDHESLLHLLKHINQRILSFKEQKRHSDKKGNINSDVNDMSTLASFHESNGDSALTPLPILMPEYGLNHKRRAVAYNHKNTPFSFLAKYASFFEGYLFDAVALGVYFDGFDPRNVGRSSLPGTIHWRSLFNPSDFEYDWEVDSEGRRFPVLTYLDKKYRIINLHFHSKRLYKFLSK
ncbi:MAG: hypothetical protein WDZ28_01205 [Simkaniaceae bacterium]